jgi:hypothetical protein
MQWGWRMGSENLHHKRKARNIEKLARKDAQRKPYDRVLIVCEGTKTERNYLQDLIDDRELSSANIKVRPSPHTCPLRLVTYALQQCEDEDYDRVYCVFDKDAHDHYEPALQEIKKHTHLYSAQSVPCFEYWLLLHFEYSTRPYGRANKSPGEAVLSDLKRKIPGYEKGSQGIFQKIKNDNPNAIACAIGYAKRANKAAHESKTDNPSTYVGELVEYLLALSQQNENKN